MPDAVLWDMDGTIVDSEPYWMAAETRMVESFGGVWTHEHGIQLVGRGLEDSASILQRAGVRREIPDIVSTLTDEVTSMLRTSPPEFRPGAVDLLRALREAGIPTALVTMSLRRMADAVVAALAPHDFDAIVSGDSARRPKPYPDPYLQAAELLGVDIERCIVIEDSPGGVRAGLASGAITIGVPHFLPLDDLGAHALWPTLEDRNPHDLAELLSLAPLTGERR